VAAPSGPSPAAIPAASPETGKDKDRQKDKDKDHPPCPTAGGPPPGHDKGAQPQDRPCGGGNPGTGGPAGGLFLTPLAPIGAALAAARRHTPRRLRLRLRARAR
jgi:hypothetical protein